MESRGVGALVCVALLTAGVAGQQPPSDIAMSTASRIGEYVQEYFSVARTIVAHEMLTLQPLTANLSDDGRARRLLYEVRVEWEPLVGDAPPVATVHRQLLTVDGRSPGPGEANECLAAATPEPLGFLLPHARAAFTFRPPVAMRVGGQLAQAIDYLPISPGVASVQWRGVCASFDLPGLMRGRITVEPTTYAVLRLEQALIRAVDIPVTRDQRRDGWGKSIRVERADVSIRYEKVVFHNPEETLRLPLEIRHVTEVRTPDMRRLKTIQRFSDYRRFVTDVRIRPLP